MDLCQLKDRVVRQIELECEEHFARLQELVRCGSEMGKEEPAQRCYESFLREANLDVAFWYPKPEDMLCNPYFLACRDDYSTSPNVVGTWRGTGGGKSLLLSGHIDVVPPGDNDWVESPWSGSRRDGRIYGRGASDMKGGLIANYMALRAIQNSGVRLKGDLILASVIGEETGGAGTVSLISHGYRADGAIVPEPSDLAICPVSLGVTWFRIRIRGYAAHAANAYLGVNAISKAAIIIQALDDYNKNKRTGVKHPLYSGENPNPFNINMGKISGGAIETSVPDEVLIEGRIAFSPNETVADARRALEEAVEKASIQDAWLRENPPVVEWHSFCLNSGQVEEGHPLTSYLCSNYKKVVGEDALVAGTPWGTDAGAMIRIGGIPTIVFGPGPNSKAHQANEFVEEKKLLDVAKTIALAAMDWCGVD